MSIQALLIPQSTGWLITATGGTIYDFKGTDNKYYRTHALNGGQNFNISAWNSPDYTIWWSIIGAGGSGSNGDNAGEYGQGGNGGSGGYGGYFYPVTGTVSSQFNLNTNYLVSDFGFYFTLATKNGSQSSLSGTYLNGGGGGAGSADSSGAAGDPGEYSSAFGNVISQPWGIGASPIIRAGGGGGGGGGFNNDTFVGFPGGSGGSGGSNSGGYGGDGSPFGNSGGSGDLGGAFGSGGGGGGGGGGGQASNYGVGGPGAGNLNGGCYIYYRLR